MIARQRGGKAGVVQYLRDGKKRGRPYARDQLDERVVLHGDLDATDKVIQTMETAGERYLHISLGFAEHDDLPNDRLAAITERYMELLLAAYEPEEVIWYAEAHRPRIKRYMNATTGATVDRLLHAHVVVPKVNLLTGGRLDPMGMALRSAPWLDAIQEQVNFEFGLVSPKDRPRAAPVSWADIIGRNRPTQFKKGRIGDFKARVANEMVTRDIRTKVGLDELLREYGEVKLRNAGRSNEYFAVKPSGHTAFINLREEIFADCTRPPAPAIYRDWHDIVERADADAALEPVGPVVGVGKKDPEDIAVLVEDWVSRRSMEIKYLNSGNRRKYQAYRALDTEAQKLILNDLADDFYIRHNHRRQHGEEQHRTRSPAPGWSSEAAVHATWQQNARRAASGAPATGIFDLPNLHSRDLDSNVHRATVLLQKPVSDRLGRSGASSDDPLRRARDSSGGARERDWAAFRAINPATGREADTVFSQLLRDQREARAIQETGQRADIREICADIDPHVLLADLASSHGICPDNYTVTQGRDSVPRIRFKKSTDDLSLIDLLSSHMHLADAVGYLRAGYSRQLSSEQRQAPTPPPQAEYWQMYQAWWWQERAKRREKELTIIEQCRQHQRALRESYRGDLTRLSQCGLPYSVFRVQRKLLKLALAKSEQDLQKDLQTASLRLAKLDRPDPRRLRYRRWLVERAEAGDWDAIAELRRQRFETEKAVEAGGRAIVLLWGRIAVQAVQPLDDLSYRVHRNGDLSVYWADGAELLRDTGSAVYVIQDDDDAIELCLRMCQKNWGNGNFSLFGDRAFIERALRVAAKRRLSITFSDEDQNIRLRRVEASLVL
ncbi:LPD7 domain-containing protein [Noviherbaspirillum aridicola]|uniref:Large polyvalent protein-associated domain-containing protein n=1 Tax=Noviherbaspirillum aridicola TaxID=2849687 RepID=A0ABQ4Q6Q2_9BURK|nr:LPD7 domain-containing protein [Noviherbaspirillum aridicola]GIZ52495.1 hypothetical protein NCCP691_25090 [Noviherbaspirillum aridicola]